jgi:hypothetical protein
MHTALGRTSSAYARLGICDNWTSISSDEIGLLFLDTTEFIPVGGGITVRVVSMKGDETRLRKRVC